MNSREIRRKFLDFFENRGHKVVASSSLLSDDPSVLLTTAGVQQFKPYYTGERDPIKNLGSRRAVSIQKSFRTSDIDQVGDQTHLTFFEMLGNFSFGDYWKPEAINWAYEFLTKELKVAPERISASVFGGDNQIPRDDESYKIWRKKIGLLAQKIKKAGKEDNFWGPTGDRGPCGPTTEIYIDGVEVWNIVFNEYFCNCHPRESGDLVEDGNGRTRMTFAKLKTRGVDTGMGLERLTAALNGATDVYQTDLLKPIIDLLPADLDERKRKVAADHARAIVFLINDGVRPSNKEAGYILRRLIRRIIVLANRVDFKEIFNQITDFYKDYYPNLSGDAAYSVYNEEQKKFEKTLKRGLKELEKMKMVDAAAAFGLYETFGLPFEVIKDYGGAKTADLKRMDFDKEFNRHQEISRAGAEKKFGGHGLIAGIDNKENIVKITRLHTATHLLQQALRDVLGTEVRQMGSDINAERTRFDFSFPRKLSVEEIKKVEQIVNQKIKENLPVNFIELPLAKAKKTGALHFFKEKYPARVKVYYIGDSLENAYSKEFCGGPHVSYTGEIGYFKIAKEESVSAGVRRIRGAVG